MLLTHFKYFVVTQVEKLKQVLFQFQNLRQLELFVEGGVYDLDMNYFWILDIITASQHLQKISITVSYSTLYFFGCPFFFNVSI